MKLTLPIQPFNDDEKLLSRLLDDYFFDKKIQINRDIENLYINIDWPDYKEYYIDPDLYQGLAWWDSQLLVKDIPFAKKEQCGYQLSLCDSWTLYAWSKWLKYNTNPLKKIVILHLDDHRDCMTPLLYVTDDFKYVDALTKHQVDLFEPDSVAEAIKSGAIAVGSFMPLFFHYCQNIELRHLLPSHRMEKSFKKGFMQNSLINDNLLGISLNRPAVIFEAQGSLSNNRYAPTENLDEFLTGIPTDSEILVHIDMDYFNNRFDGDSDWIHKEFTHNPDEAKTLANIYSVFNRILEIIPQGQLKDITIALSPGFFPAEYWKKSIDIIDHLFKSLGYAKRT